MTRMVGALLALLLFTGCASEERPAGPPELQEPLAEVGPVADAEKEVEEPVATVPGPTQTSRDVVLHVTGMKKSKGDAT